MIVGLPIDELAPLSENFQILTANDNDDWLGFALENNAEIKIAYKRFKSSQSQSKAASAGHLPVFDLEIRYQNNTSTTGEIDNGQVFNFESGSAETSIVISASVPIFSGGTISAQKRAAKYQQHATESEYKAIQADITRQVNTLIRRSQKSSAILNANTRSAESSLRALVAIRKGYAAGISDITSVLDAQQLYQTSSRRLINARYDHIITILELQRTAGTLTPRVIFELNIWLEQDGNDTLDSSEATENTF